MIVAIDMLMIVAIDMLMIVAIDTLMIVAIDMHLANIAHVICYHDRMWWYYVQSNPVL